jgi:hypothetical protein
MPKLYIGRFTNSQVLYSDNSDFGQEVIVKIIDVTDTSDQEVEIDLADNPVTIRVIDNSEDKFTPIRSKACELRLHTSPNINIMTFGGGGDNQYKVQIRMDSSDLDVFEGWLSISDLRQDFQPDPNVLVLTATDGLGFLKDVPLTDYNGNTFKGPNRLADYIAGCLRKTGLEKSLIAEMNVRESTQVASYLGHIYHTIYVDAQTFATSIQEYQDCFTVLEKILGEYCELSQQKNEWYIRAIDEFDAQDSIQVRFNSAGQIQSQLPLVAYDKLIGSNMSLYQMGFMNDDASMSLQRPYKFVKHIFNFELPEELPCNIDFNRGDFIADLPDETIDGKTYTAKSYEVQCWDPLWSNTSSDDYQATGIYIKKLFDEFGNQFAHSLNLDDNASRFTFVMSEPIPVQAKDKFELSLERRLSSDVSGSGSFIDLHVQVRLYGSNGTFWTHDSGTSVDPQRAWVQCTSTFRTNQKYFAIEGDVVNDLTEAIGLYNGESAEIPVSGEIRILLYRSSLYGDTRDTFYSNVRFEYIPWVNGSYRQYTGQEHQVEQSGDYKASREENVYISDSPARVYKGALQKVTGTSVIYTGSVQFNDGNQMVISGNQLVNFNVGTDIVITGTVSNNITTKIVANYYNPLSNNSLITVSGTFTNEIVSCTISKNLFGLTEGFYNGAVFPSGPPDPTFVKPYGQIQNEAVWNQFNRVFTAFEGTIDGLDTYVKDGEDRIDIPDLMHSFFIMDAHPATNNKKFKLLHMDQNYDLCEWGLYLIEVYDSTIPKVYTGHSFKFLQNDR